jgi:CSLREA domain-containing protein
MTLLVTTTADELNPDDNQLSLREAINQAQPGDTIELPAGTYAITRANANGQSEDANVSGDFDIATSLTIEGAGAAATVITSALGDTTPDRIFDVLGAVTVEFRGVTISGGHASEYDTGPDYGCGGGIRAAGGGIVTLTNIIVENNSAPGGEGGGIFVATPRGASGGGSLILENSAVLGNKAVAVEGGGEGSGIASEGSHISITGSTISGNTADQDGGGIYMGSGNATLTNSTVSGNTSSARYSGGGIFISDTSSLFLTNVTVTANTAGYTGGGIDNDGGDASLMNTIVAGNTSGGGPDVFGDFTSDGHNLIGIADGSRGFTDGQNGDLVGSADLPLDPKLGPLQDNGGPTFTHALLPGSPALDAGADVDLSYDQRGPGYPRAVDGNGDGIAAPDIGAFEFSPSQPPPATGAIGGMVFLDYDADGRQDRVADPVRNETPLAGLTVYLDTNNSGTYDPGEPTASTGADGRYLLSGLAPGTYTVRQLYQPDHGTVETGPAGGVYTVTLAAGQQALGNDFGNVFLSQVTPVEVTATTFPQGPDANTSFVQGLYHNLLARGGEPGGRAYWVNRLQSGDSRDAIVDTFWVSSEHRGLQVQHYYHTYLNRAPDAAGLAFWTQAFTAGGMTEAAMVLDFVMSAEYQGLGPGDTAFLTTLYGDMLSRGTDAGGLAYWQQQLPGLGRQAVAQQVIASGESYLRMIDGYYAALLHRAPETTASPGTGMTGRQFWLGALQGGSASPADVGCAFLSLAEYFSNAAAFSLPPLGP